MIKQKRSYIICATPRSGSTLLCDLLTDTGIAGRPNSFFRRESFSEWVDIFEVLMTEWRSTHEFDDAYLSAVLREGRNGTAVFGMRLMQENIDDLSKRLESFYPTMASDSARFQSAFGEPLYIHLSRKDKVAQAVSRLKAEQSGLWHIFADGTERERLDVGKTPRYDSHQISRWLSQAEEDDFAWTSWFAQQNIEPLRINYEELTAEPQAVLGRVLSFLGLDPAVAEVARATTAKLADDESLEWIKRFYRKTRSMS